MCKESPEVWQVGPLQVGRPSSAHPLPLVAETPMPGLERPRTSFLEHVAPRQSRFLLAAAGKLQGFLQASERRQEGQVRGQDAWGGPRRGRLKSSLILVVLSFLSFLLCFQICLVQTPSSTSLQHPHGIQLSHLPAHASHLCVC